MKIGFIGNNKGLSINQIDSILGLLKDLKPDEIMHKDDLGTGREFNVLSTNIETKRIIYSSGIIDYLDEEFEVNEIIKYTDEIEVNKEIINNSDIMIFVPEYDTDCKVFVAIQYAKDQKKKVYIIYPNGDIHNK